MAGVPPEIWFAPNIGSVDLLDLFRSPDRWPEARSQTRVLQLYAQHVYLDGAHPAAKNGPNHWGSLQEVSAWSKLTDWGLDLAIEIGAVKWAGSPGACTAEDNEHTAQSVIDRVASFGGQVKALAIDEALVSGLDRSPGFGCGLTLAQTVEFTGRFIRNLCSRNPHVRIGVIEAYPANDTATIIAFMEGLQRAHASPAFLHLDVDRYGIRDKKIPADKMARDLRRIQYQCGAWQVPFGVILFGQRVETAEDYRDDVLRWLKRLRGALGSWPDRLIVQSWEEVHAQRTLPHNLPETDRDSHTGLLAAVRREAQAT